MAGDYTRFTFEPAKGFSGVHKQQGRVSLDADFNEFEEILDRRRRAHTYDTFNSRAIVPRTTQNGFKIYLTGTQLNIGPGRAYVDGILAECFGNLDLKLSYDNVLGGVSGGQLPYDKQPFYYSPDYPELKAGSINTVYLDVWQREVTVFEDDALREPALNGPDTATRVQTAWQVKILKEPAKSSNCADTPPGWQQLTAPSSVRLTAKADEVLAPPPGPCEINPASGYSGLENRLYRVEIHQGGTLGGGTKPQFKWSRDNASLAARVVKVDKAAQSTLTVSSTGRDKVTRFAVNDHIELIDDDIEFAMRETGVGGLMLKVTAVDYGNQTITVDSSLAAFTLHAARHPRIRRWDYLTTAEALTRDVTAGAPNNLGNGISVTFDGTATGTLHAGDYWVFEARTVDGSIGRLVDAPPRGILHHFAKLAYVTIGNTPTDCRTFWPPTFTGGGTSEGCCTVVVKPGDDIQSAIDSLDGKGGCVCLKMGVHVIPSALRIDQDNLTMHAEAPWVTVRLAEGGPLMLRIESARNVSVLGIKFEAPSGNAGTPMIELDAVRGGHLADCVLGFNEGVDLKWTAAGIRMDSCSDYVVEDNSLEGFATGITGQESNRLRIVGNMLTGPVWRVTDNFQVSAGTMGIVFADVEGIDVERNVVSDYRRGIQIGDLSTAPARPALDLGRTIKGCRIVENVVTRRGGVASDQPSALYGASGSPTVVAFGIAARMPRCEILENAVQIGGLGDSGILADCGNVLVARNLLQSTVVFDPKTTALRALPNGVVATVRDADGLACIVRDNLFLGLQQAVLVSGTSNAGPVHRVEVVSNHIVASAQLVAAFVASIGTGPSAPYAALLLVERYASIAVVSVTLGRVANNEIAGAVCGILCAAASGVAIEGNSIGTSLVGVALGLAVDCEANDNLIDQTLIGVLLGATERLAVESNVVNRGMFGILELLGKNTRIDSNHVSGGTSGIDLFAVEGEELRGNTVEDAATAGVLVLAVSREISLSHNKALRCGYRKNAAATTLSFGMMVAATDASVLVESCQAIDTGESATAGDPAFVGGRLGIVVAGEQLRVRVHGCTIANPATARTGGTGASLHAASRALLIMGVSLGKKQNMSANVTAGNAGAASEAFVSTADQENFRSWTDAGSLDFADAADNLAEQAAPIVVEIVTPGEVIFASNRCTRLGKDELQDPVVVLTGAGLAVTGNRVRATSKAPSLELRASNVLTAVANIATAGATLVGATEVPAGYNNYNATT